MRFFGRYNSLNWATAYMFDKCLIDIDVVAQRTFFPLTDFSHLSAFKDKNC